ncbi:phage tail assembly chaperone [Roseococcus sp. YIM B11640]|uniref:phage tail assembly chaperone n=1 Tax=Roseococcus sp. YIM B11640 TaxID=3133973 RepID=UPI003C7B08E6
MERERAEEELSGPPKPEAAAYLWDWFLEMHRARGGGMGPAAITHQDIEAWGRLKGVRLAPWELEAIQALDGTWLAVQAEKE